MKRAVSAGIAGSLAGALAASGIGLSALAQSGLGDVVAIEQPATDDALRDQIRSVVGRALEDGESAEYIDQLVNEAAAEGKLFVPETMRLPDGSVNTDAMIAFLNGDQPSFQPPTETATATATAAATGGATSGATGAQLLQPSSGATTRTTALLQPAPAASGGTSVGNGLTTGSAAASGSQLLQPQTATPSAQTAELTPTAPSTPSPTATGSQLLQPGAAAPGESDTVETVSGADIATAAQIGAGTSAAASETVSALQPLQPGEGDAAAEPADPAAAANALLLQPAEGTAGTAPAEPEPETETAEATETDSAEADTVVALANPAPDAEPEVTEADAELGEGELYIVQRGDSLSTIAERLLGDPFRFEEIFEANRDRLSNPNVIVEGQRLRIPR